MMSTGIKKVNNRGNVLRDATVREFGGGWNVVDNDLNLSTRFATLLDNMSREEDGSMGVRWGTKLLADTHDANWIDPADITIIPPSSGSSGATYNNIVAPIANPDAFIDDNDDLPMASSTHATATGKNNGGAFSMALVATYTVAQTIDIVVAYAPQEGWFTGDVNLNTAATLKISLEIDGELLVARQQEYTVGTLPERFHVTSLIDDAGNRRLLRDIDVTAVRLDIELAAIARNDTITMGCAELAVGDYTGSGEIPGDVYIVNHYYFQDSVIIVMSNGLILRSLGDGSISVVWSPAIAAGLVGAPDGWGPTDFASFAVFNGKLIICNGTDKPLIMDFNNTPPVQYLADESTGSNVNVPICRYVVAMNKYLVMAGDPLFPDRVHISNQNTSGTWFNDPAPNDGVYVDLGKVGVQGEQTITGINRYRDQLVVGFFSASVLGKLGIYTADDPPVHDPDFNDVVEGFGCHSHRSMVNLGNDLFMLDGQGITSIARSLYSGATEPKRVSELIDPEVNANVNRLRDQDTILGAHGVYNSNDKQYMCFIPNYSEQSYQMQIDPIEVVRDTPNALKIHITNHQMQPGDRILLEGIDTFNTVDVALLNDIVHTVTRVINEDIIYLEVDGLVTDPNDQIMGGGVNCMWTPQWTETLGYIYTFVNELKIRAWARYRSWRWRSSCRTELGNVIFADDTKLYTYGNQNNKLYSDFIGTENEAPIIWQWEMPWADFDQRVMLKHNRYMQLDTRGTATFTMMMFVDELYQIDGELIPNNVLTLVGGDNGGYGNNGQPYGGGRRTSDQRLYDWPARGKLFKLRYQGVTSEPLRVVAISLMYQNGSIRR